MQSKIQGLSKDISLRIKTNNSQIIQELNQLLNKSPQFKVDVIFIQNGELKLKG